MVASRDIASGAALRASAISALRSGMRYRSIGAILGYRVLVSWALAKNSAPKTATKASVANAMVLANALFVLIHL
jgi:hypothetical protein